MIHYAEPVEKKCYQIHVNRICGLRPPKSSTVECYVAAKIQDEEESYELKSDKVKGSSDFSWQENLKRLNLRPTCTVQFVVRTSTLLRLQRRVVATTKALPLADLIARQGQELKPKVYIELPLLSADENEASAGSININIRTIIRDTGKEAAEYNARRNSHSISSCSSASGSCEGHGSGSDHSPPLSPSSSIASPLSPSSPLTPWSAAPASAPTTPLTPGFHEATSISPGIVVTDSSAAGSGTST